MIPFKQVIEGVILFAETELLPALNGWRWGVASSALILAGTRTDALYSLLSGYKVVSALGVMDKDGNVDAEAALSALKQTVRKEGKFTLDIPVLDISYNLTEKDIETLRGYIVKTPQND